MPKYWVKKYFAHGRFPEVGQKQKTEKREKKKEKKMNDGNYNGQATHGARKPPGPKSFKDYCFLMFRSRRTSKTFRQPELTFVQVHATHDGVRKHKWPLLTDTYFFLSVYSFSPIHGVPGSWIFMGTHILTRLEEICKMPIFLDSQHLVVAACTKPSPWSI